MVVTLAGMVTDVNPPQRAKAPLQNSSMPSSRVREVKPEQYSNAQCPIVFTLEGMVMEVRLVQCQYLQVVYYQLFVP